MKKYGVLLPVFSLPGKGGIGRFGDAYPFIDFLAEAGQDFWQILPLLKADYSGSPYQSDSAFAIDPMYIDPYLLIADGYLMPEEVLDTSREKRAERKQTEMLKTAYSRFKTSPPEDYADFLSESGFWLDDYALFSVIAESEGTPDFTKWKDTLSRRESAALDRYRKEHADSMDFIKFVQYEADRQWQGVRAYAAKKGIKIIGDLPMYVSHASADVWANREIFMLDEDGRPTLVAGVPPDAFTEDGQLWGNPVYNIPEMRKSGYAWQMLRFKRTARLCDVVRLDHFRGYESFYAVKAGSPNARKGEWLEGLGAEFFDLIAAKFPSLEIIAEDLGIVTDAVRELIKHTGYPNMKVLQFGLDGDLENDHLPKNYSENCVAYTGTHDNDTCVGWYKSLSLKEKRAVKRLVKKRLTENISDAMIRALIESKAKYVIVPMQDWLREGHASRINLPGSVGSHNWTYRLSAIPDRKTASRMRKITHRE